VIQPPTDLFSRSAARAHKAELQTLHQRIDELARLEPAAMYSVSLLVFRVLQAACWREGR
jgi:hypothetical protein